MDGGHMTEGVRIPPQSAEAEQSVLGGLMIPEVGNAAYAKISDWLTADDFYRRDHQLIYRAIAELAEKKTPFDCVTVGEWFDAQGLSEHVQGGAYLIELSSTVPSAANIVAYAEIVRDKAVLRRFIELGTTIVNDGFQPNGRDSHELIADAAREIAQMAGNPRAGGVKSMKDVGSRWFNDIQRRYNDKGGLSGLPTPWSRFNELTGGLNPGELVIVAGRPSMGKSALAVNIATCNALRGKRVLFFNLEMTDVSIYNRCIASVMDVPLSWLRKPDDDHPDANALWARVTEGVRRMREANLAIDDSPALRHEQICARAKREHMRQPVDLIVVDHLHLMPLPGKTRETVEIGHITSGFKGLAKELNCSVICLSQLNRSLETRKNKRPVMADLRESGNIEQDADIIAFVYRDDYYAEQEERRSEYPDFVEINIAKQREGETGKVWARNRLSHGLIEDYSGEAPTSRVATPDTDTQTGRGFRRQGNRYGSDA